MKRAILVTSYFVLGAVVGLARLIITVLFVCAVVLTILVLAGQLYGWHKSGHLHLLPLSQSLQIIGVDLPMAHTKAVRKVIDLVLAIPTAGILFLLSIVFFGLNRVAQKLEHRRRQGLRRASQRDLLGTIEKTLEADPRLKTAAAKLPAPSEVPSSESGPSADPVGDGNKQ
jgi:hypothetical protein